MVMLWVLLIIIAALVIGTAIDKFMEKHGIRPADPDERSGGFRDVIAKVQEWTARRRLNR